MGRATSRRLRVQRVRPGVEGMEGRLLLSGVRAAEVRPSASAGAAMAIRGTVSGGLLLTTVPGSSDLILSLSGVAKATAIGALPLTTSHRFTPEEFAAYATRSLNVLGVVLTLQTPEGDLSARFDGETRLLRPGAVRFDVRAVVLGGTGAFSGASGRFVTRGTLDLAAGRLDGHVAGTLRTAARSGFALGPLVQVSGPSPFGPGDGDAVPNSEVEPRVAVDPNHPDHLVGVWQQDRFPDEGARGTGVAVSFDGGLTWQASIVPGYTIDSGGTFERASDPWVSFGRRGVVYVSSIAFDETSATGGGGQSTVYVSRSTDGGRTFGPPTALVREASPLRATDKDSITADPSRPRFAYAAWEALEVPPTLIPFGGPAIFARTTDGGRSWEPSRTIYDPGPNAITINHQLFVRPGGELIDTFTEFRADLSGQGPLFRSALMTSRSKDRGRTFGPPTPASMLLGLPVTDPDNGRPLRTSSTPSGLPAQFASVAMDPRNGDLYAAWQDARFSGGAYDSVAFAMSADGGRTWSAPIPINRPPTSTVPPADLQAFDPTIAVSRDGTVAVSFYDFRNNTPAPGALADAWLVVARRDPTDPASWTDPIRLTDQSFDVERAPKTTGGLTGGGYFLGDYQGLVATDRWFLAFFSQPGGGDPASIFARRVEIIGAGH